MGRAERTGLGGSRSREGLPTPADRLADISDTLKDTEQSSASPPEFSPEGIFVGCTPSWGAFRIGNRI